MRNLLITLTLLLAVAAGAAAQEPAKGYQFTDGKCVKVTPVRDQSRSGTCWAYSTLAFIENEILRAGGEPVELSAMWVVRNIYFEKAVKYVRMHGTINFAVGGAAHDVTHAIERYGIVPTEVYKGLNYGTDKPNFGEIDEVLKAYVNAIIKNKNRSLTTAWQAGLNGILDAYFGPMPEKFTYKGTEYTPHSFAESLPVRMDDYVSLTSFTHHPYYKPFVMEIPDNWLWASSYNVPLEELMAVVDGALAADYSIAWGADVSERGFSRTKGIAVMPETDLDNLSGTEAERWGKLTAKEREDAMYKFDGPVAEKQVTQQMRQQAFDNWQTTDDHGMVIVGTATDQNGNPFFKVKNSWGDREPYGGYWYFSRPFVEYKTMTVMVNRNALPKPLRKKLKL